MIFEDEVEADINEIMSDLNNTITWFVVRNLKREWEELMGAINGSADCVSDVGRMARAALEYDRKLHDELGKAIVKAKKVNSPYLEKRMGERRVRK